MAPASSGLSPVQSAGGGAASGPPPARLALFDLDHTLLNGDTDALWCEFLMDQGLLDRAQFEPRNDAMVAAYRASAVDAQTFCSFYTATLAGRSPERWAPWLRRFMDERIAPRLPQTARGLVQWHRERGDRLVLTTATNRLLTALTARHLDIADLIATEVEVVQGLCSGRTQGVVNMREGKVTRLQAWLHEQGVPEHDLTQAVFYSDSYNDLPLLSRVGQPVAVDPDERLRAHAQANGWQVLALAR